MTDVDPKRCGEPMNPLKGTLVLQGGEGSAVEVRMRLRCGGRESCYELAEFITKRRGVRSSRIVYEVSGDILEISVVGSPYDVLSARRAIAASYREWRKLREFKLGGSGRLALSTLMSYVGGPVMVDVLLFLLRDRGYDAEVRNNILETNAPADVVFSIAQEVSNKLEEVSKDFPKATRGLKALLVALAVIGYDAESSLDALKRMGLIEENHKLKVTAEWTSLLVKLRTVDLGGEGVEAGDKEG